MASHARFGRTTRNAVMFGQPGFAYVYFVYGMHFMFNVVTEEHGRAGAVLIRALQPVEGAAVMADRRRRSEDLANGPAKLCQAMEIDLRQNGADLTRGPLGIWRRNAYGPEEVVSAPRIGVVGSVHEPYRYYVKDNPHVSR
jgi:DNA-3-methyladenine glycosylase